MLRTESTTPVAVQYLRGLDPHLPRSVWLLQASVLANTFGNGLVIPFVLRYLHDVRGIPVATAAWIAAASPSAALASGLLRSLWRPGGSVRLVHRAGGVRHRRMPV